MSWRLGISCERRKPHPLVLPPSPPWLPEPEKSFWPSPSARAKWGDGQLSDIEEGRQTAVQEHLRAGGRE